MTLALDIKRPFAERPELLRDLAIQVPPGVVHTWVMGASGSGKSSCWQPSAAPWPRHSTSMAG